jgi:uncharacterized protein YqfB (UPF0267 family)
VLDFDMIMSYIGNMKKTENTMSKIVRAIEIMKANPALAKKEMVELFMAELTMNKANANGYFVSATKKLGNPKTAPVREGKRSLWPKTAPVRVKKAPTEKQIAAIRVAAEKKTKKTERVEFNEKAKAYRLEQLKEVSERMKKIEGERDQMYAEMEEYENEAMKYVREHAPAFLRKELNLL